MPIYRDADSPVRLTFQRGPWRSPRSHGWQEAYDALVARVHRAGFPLYGVLEAGLAGGEVGGAGWRERFAANAAYVVERYADRIPAFEVLPGANLQGPDGRERLAPDALARAWAEAYGRIKGSARGRDVALVAGATALANDGAAYLARAMEVGGAAPWGAAPWDAIAVWPALPDAPGPVPAGALEAQLDALRRALGARGAAAAWPLVVSGMTWRARGPGDYGGEDIQAALAALRRSQPEVQIAAREAAASGPAFATPEGVDQATLATFAVFSLAPRASPTRELAVPAEAPVVDGFDFPVGSREQATGRPAGYAITTTLADAEYYANPVWGGAWHPGEDWAAFGGCDASLGHPVYAIADGVVICQQYYSPSWGRITLIQHRLRSGARVWSQYAHLDSALVEEQQVVLRGQQIGTIGKGANNKYCAHLHFEVRNADLAPDQWFPLVRDKGRVLANYLSPAKFIDAHRPMAFADRRGVIVDNMPGEQEGGAFVRAETAGPWLTSYYGWRDTADAAYAHATESAWGEWRPKLPAAGRYEVQAWIPSQHATTQKALYVIHHAGGVSTRALDQGALNDEWASLGTYDFGAEGARVRLTDQTDEPEGARKEVCFDAVRWLPVVAP